MSNVMNWLLDAQATVIDGMNAGREPELIGDQQAALLRNMSIRGGRMKTRPAIVKRMALPAGKLQGSHVFKAVSRILVSVDGCVYEVDPVDWSIEEKTGWLSAEEQQLPQEQRETLIESRRNAAKRPRHWYCETIGSVVIQDFQAAPLIYDGTTIRRAGEDEVPVGGAMAYGNGRLAVVVNRGYDVRIGDIRQSEHQSELKFTETYSLTGGGDFSFPTPVKALAYLPVIDTGSGHGPLVVGCEDQTYTLKTNITARDLWSEIGMQTVLLPTRGITGPNAVVAVNQDLYFRSSDGLRSLRTSTADYDAPGLAPISVEVRHRFDYDTPFLLEDAQVAYFDNRVLCTHSPFVYSNRSLAQGLIALNFDALSGRGAKTPPAFDGEWDGVLVASITTGRIRGVDRCFIIGRDVDGSNGLWEVLPESAVVDDAPQQVFESRMLFGSNGAVLKILRRMDIELSDLRGDVTVRAYFRAEKFPFWVRWDEWTIRAPVTPDTWGRVRSQHRAPLQTRSVPDKFDPWTGRPVSVGTGFQVRIELSGRARIDVVKVFQEPITPGAYAEDVVVDGPVVLTAPDWAADPGFWYSHPVSPLAGLS